MYVPEGLYVTDRTDFVPEPAFEPLTPRTERHVRGRKCWVRFWIIVFVGLYWAAATMTQRSWCEGGLCLRSWWAVTRMYLCTFVAAVLALWYMWKGVARDEGVPLGLLVSVWFTAGTLSVGFCALFNWSMVQFWAWLNPVCFITYPADNWPWAYTSLQCIIFNLFQWIVTAGGIEESLKFAALLRLRPTPAKVRDGIDACRCRLPVCREHGG